jgi:hypothetical protein
MKPIVARTPPENLPFQAMKRQSPGDAGQEASVKINLTRRC